MLFQLGYVSTASRVMRRRDLIEILTEARRLNARDAITGLLLFHGRHFLQVLEGEEARVRATFGRIREDRRHHDISVLFEHPVESREYPDWSMGFQALDGTEWIEFPDVAARTKGLREIAEDHGRATQLLMLIRRKGVDASKDIATAEDEHSG